MDVIRLPSQKGDTARRDIHRVTRAVVVNQMLFAAGYALTTGGFLTYFGRELGASSFAIAVLLAVPETVGVLGLSSRWVIQRVGKRKTVWAVCSLLARFASVGIPLLAFASMRPTWGEPFWWLIAWLAVSQALGAIAYMAYLSWLSDLVPEVQWGRFFAKRDISHIVILLCVPVIGGYLRDSWGTWVKTQHWSPEDALLAYVVTFAAGIALLLLSMIPVLRLPDVPVRAATVAWPEWRLIVQAWRDRSMRFLLVHNWWLALAQGMTQAAFFKYSTGPLGITLTQSYLLLNTMNLVKIPVAAVAGRLCDRRGAKRTLLWGVVAVSFAMPFWLLAGPETWWWLFAAHAVWGVFAAVNLAGHNLTMKLAPRSDNAAHLALFQQVGGLLAGLSGLAGGLWLDALLDAPFVRTLGTWRIEGYQLLFLISWLGRLTAAAWLVPIREPREAADGREDA